MAVMPIHTVPGSSLINQGGAANRLVQNTAAATAKGGTNPAGTAQKATAAAPAKAGTYTDAHGFIHQIGTGTVVGSTKGATFTDGKGNVRLVGTPPAPATHAATQPAAGHTTTPPAGGGATTPTPTQPPVPTTPLPLGYEWSLQNGAWTQVPAGGTNPLDGQYQTELAQAQYDKQLSENDLNNQLTQLAPKYAVAMKNRQDAFNEDYYKSNSDLAARGALHTGETNKRNVAANWADVQNRQGIDQQYGDAARSQITQRLAQLNQAYSLQQNNLIAQATQRYQQLYPASQFLSQQQGAN